MKHRRLVIGLALLGVCYLTQFTVAVATRKAGPTKFTVKVENISNPEGMTASNGVKFPFALSPGMFVLSTNKAPLFSEGKAAPANGLEMQAEDGDPSGLVKSLEVMHHASNLHGVFNTPVGAMGAGPIRPGNSYEYTFTAMPGLKFFTTMMFGQIGSTRLTPTASRCLMPKAIPSAATSPPSSSCGTRALKSMKRSASGQTRDPDRKARIPELMSMVLCAA
jgi:hypothetical protein